MARLVAAGAEMERIPGGTNIARHHHEAAYAALVLSGGYVEAGDRGRVRAGPGNVLFHTAFEGHFNVVAATGADILNLPLAKVPGVSLGFCDDPDEVARVAATDPAVAAELLLSTTVAVRSDCSDWPDLLAADLGHEVAMRLDTWAAERGLSPSEISRGFSAAYGVTPKRYRLEQRAARAARAIQRGMPLSDAAFAAGFADQPHMTRTFGTLFGCSPRRLRI